MKACCLCGGVEIELHGVPITSVICYCKDCQAGARAIEALAGAPPVQSADGGTAYVVYRKDRVQVVKGAELLTAMKLRATSSTSRVIAACCNAAMHLSFDDSKHWIDIYSARIGTGALPPEFLICTKSAPDLAMLPADVPRHSGYPLRFLGKLIRAKIAMLFGH
jgi:hypothetical protein